MEKINRYLSHDYEMFIQELKEDLDDGVLRFEDSIYVLREEIVFVASIPYVGKRLIKYNPIIDWYFGDECEEETSKERKEQYIADKESLIEMKVYECLEYMIKRSAPMGINDLDEHTIGNLEV